MELREALLLADDLQDIFKYMYLLIEGIMAWADSIITLACL